MKPSRRFAKVFIALYTAFFLVLYLPRLVGIERSGVFANIQHVWQDFLFKYDASRRKSGDPRLILVAVDEETGRKHGFPLPRAVYARALDKLKTLGVRTVAFDVLFFEPREGDAELAAATKRFGRVVHLFSQGVRDTPRGPLTTTDLPVQPLRKEARYLGHPDVGHLLNDDGHLRRYELFRAGTPDPLRSDFDAVSLAAATLSAYLDKSPEEIRSEYGSDLHLLNFRAPRTWLRHEKRDEHNRELSVEQVTSPYRRISLLDILAGDLTAAQRQALNGSIVILGSTALGYYDHYPTPFLESAPGAEFHLNMIDNELNGDMLRSWLVLGMVGVIAGAMFLSYAFQLVSPAVGAGLAGATFLGWLGFCLWMFRRGVVLEFVPPAAALLSSYLVLVVRRVLTEGAEKRMIKNLFGQFVAPEIVHELAQDPSKVKLGGEKRDLTIFFLDIAHFTSISEKMDPEALLLFLNKYLSRLSHVIHGRRGTIDKYIGDCIMAFWNAPIANPDHRADAILAALECQEAIKGLNKTLDPGLPEIPAVRIGVNSGTATVGLTGSEKKLQYTVIGDEVNLASRLEGANKFFGSRIIVSEPAYEGAKDRVAARPLGRVRVVGKETPIRIFEPVGEKGRLSAAWEKGLPAFEAGVAAFEARKYDEALSAFQRFAEIFPEDGPGQLYVARCQEYAVLPPDENWDGVFNLTAK